MHAVAFGVRASEIQDRQRSQHPVMVPGALLYMPSRALDTRALWPAWRSKLMHMARIVGRLVECQHLGPPCRCVPAMARRPGPRRPRHALLVQGYDVYATCKAYSRATQVGHMQGQHKPRRIRGLHKSYSFKGALRHISCRRHIQGQEKACRRGMPPLGQLYEHAHRQRWFVASQCRSNRTAPHGAALACHACCGDTHKLVRPLGAPARLVQRLLLHANRGSGGAGDGAPRPGDSPSKGAILAASCALLALAHPLARC